MMFNPNDLESCGISVNTGMYPGLMQNFMMGRPGVPGENPPQGIPTSSSFYPHHNPNIKSSAPQLPAANVFLPAGAHGIAKDEFMEHKMQQQCQHAHSRSSASHSSQQPLDSKPKMPPNFDRYNSFPSLSQPVFPGIPAPQVPVIPRQYVDKMAKLSKRLDGMDHCSSPGSQSGERGMSQPCTMGSPSPSQMHHSHPSSVASVAESIKSETTMNPSCSYAMQQKSAHQGTSPPTSHVSGSPQEKHVDQAASSDEIPVPPKKRPNVTKSNTKKVHRCEKCSKDFSSKWHLERHLLTHEGVKGNRPKPQPKQNHKCEKCGRSFSSIFLLDRHIERKHAVTERFTCDVCDKKFSDKFHFERHHKSHFVDRPFACEECGQTFTRRDKQKRHMMIHTGEKPHSCHVCDKAFARKDKLQRHLLTHSSEKPFACPVCGIKFARKDRRDIHERVHSAELAPDPMPQPQPKPKKSKKSKEAASKMIDPANLHPPTMVNM